MALTPLEVATQLGELLDDFTNEVIDKAEFITAYTALWQDATTGGTSIALIGAQVSSVLGLWKFNQDQFADWMTGDPAFDSTDPDQPEIGWYPLTNSYGVTRWYPSPERMLADFAGINVKGTLSNTSQLPSVAPAGDAYIINGHVWVRNPGGWSDAGQFVGPAGPAGPIGEKGWSPTFSLVADGTRYVLRVVDWIGGQGAKPATGEYVGSAGLVSTAAAAINIRGPQGVQGDQGVQGVKGDTGAAYTPTHQGLFSARSTYDSDPEGNSYLATDQGNIYFRVGAAGGWTAAIPFGKGDKGDKGDTGDKGWSPILAVVTDGSRRVWQVSDWVGGQGTKPATGSYLGATGLVSTLVDAIDVRGPAGAAGSTGAPGAAGAAGPAGPQGPKFSFDATGNFSGRAAHDNEAVGYTYFAVDQGLFYTRTGSVGTWTDGAPIIGSEYIRFYYTGNVVPGQLVSVNAGVVTSLDQVWCGINGVKIRAGDYGLVLTAGQIRFTPDADVSGIWEVALYGGVRGEKGDQGDVGPQGPPGDPQNLTAQVVSFDNSGTDLAAQTAQDAIEEVNSKIAGVATQAPIIPRGWVSAFRDYFDYTGSPAPDIPFFRTGGRTDRGLASGRGRYTARPYTGELVPLGARGVDGEFFTDPTASGFPGDYPAMGQVELAGDGILGLRLSPVPSNVLALIPKNGDGSDYKFLGAYLSTRHSFNWWNRGDWAIRCVYKGPAPVGSWAKFGTANRGPDYHRPNKRKVIMDWPETVGQQTNRSWARTEWNAAEAPGDPLLSDWPGGALDVDLGFNQTADFHEYIMVKRGKSISYYADGYRYLTKTLDAAVLLDTWNYLEMRVTATGPVTQGVYGVLADGTTARAQFKEIEVYLPEQTARRNYEKGDRPILGVDSLQIYPAKGAGTVDQTTWAAVGGATMTTGAEVDDLVPFAVISSGGALTDRMRAVRTLGVVGATKYQVRVEYDYDTSGKLQVWIETAPGTVYSKISVDAVGNVNVEGQDLPFAHVERFDHHYELVFDLVAPGSVGVSSDIYISAGPFSAVAAEKVKVANISLRPYS